MTDPENNHHQYRYDKLLRLVEITRNGEVVATYAYNALSQRTDLWRGTQDNFVIHTNYSYNHPMKWLTGVYNYGSNNTTLLSRYDYAEHDLVGNRTMIRFEQKQPDGTVFLVKRKYEYDELYQLTREITDGTINYDHRWQYDCVGNRLKFIKHETGETITYKYNAANQLTREVSNINGVTRYSYDANGNMIQKRHRWRITRYVYDIEDRLRLAFGPEGLGFYLHDALGRRTLRFAGTFKPKEEAPHFNAGMKKRRSGQHKRRSHDAAAERNATSAADSDAVLQDWLHGIVMDLESGCRYGFPHLVRLMDGIRCRLPWKFRRRIVLERYFYDGADVIADYDLFGRFCKASYLTPFLDENLLVDRHFCFGRAKRYWYTQDGLGSVRQLISDFDSVLNSYAYTAWGIPLNWQGRILNRYTFTGREYCSETSFYHYRARQYDHRQGIFTQRAPGFHLNYSYCNGNPCNYIDPSGLWMEDIHFYLTYYLARFVPCLTPAEAFTIAEANQATDEMMTSLDKRFRWIHFPTRQQVCELVNSAIRECDPIALGRALHSLQDYFAHTLAGYGPAVGHIGPRFGAVVRSPLTWPLVPLALVGDLPCAILGVLLWPFTAGPEMCSLRPDDTAANERKAWLTASATLMVLYAYAAYCGCARRGVRTAPLTLVPADVPTALNECEGVLIEEQLRKCPTIPAFALKYTHDIPLAEPVPAAALLERQQVLQGLSNLFEKVNFSSLKKFFQKGSAYWLSEQKHAQFVQQKAALLDVPPRERIARRHLSSFWRVREWFYLRAYSVRPDLSRLLEEFPIGPTPRK